MVMAPSELPVFITRAEVPSTRSGALDGWDIAVKDNIDVAGLRTTGGTRSLQHHVAAADAAVVSKLRLNGARVVGKTNMHELGHGITGINPTHGTMVHPDNAEFTVGGSSGGSAIAVQLGYARVALGTDTGGSVRIPSAYTGLVGYRPSKGRYPTNGVLGISNTRDTVGTIARSVQDVIAIDRVLTGSTVRSPSAPLVLGVLVESYAEATPAIRELISESLARLRKAGVDVRTFEVSREPERLFELGLTVLFYETLQCVEAYLRKGGSTTSLDSLIRSSETPDVRSTLEHARDNPPTKDDYQSALTEISRLHSKMGAYLEEAGVSALLYPTSEMEAPRAAAPLSEEDAATQLRLTVRNSTPATLFGTPALSLNMGRNKHTGLSTGITVERLDRSDVELLGSARLIEQILNH